jgi:hypothetical protein
MDRPYNKMSGAAKTPTFHVRVFIQDEQQERRSLQPAEDSVGEMLAIRTFV